MEWLQVFTVLGATSGLLIWFRSESRSDNRELRASTEAILNGIREDIKDFHGRLCSLEERVREPKKKPTGRPKGSKNKKK